MQDRTPTYPGRVTLTPVTGQDNTYDMAMADQPVAAGTPLNKASLLDDTVAAAIAAIEASATPDTPNEALALLAAAVSGRGRVEVASYVGTNTFGSANPNTITFSFTPKIVLFFGEANEAMGPFTRVTMSATYWYAPAFIMWGVTRYLEPGYPQSSATAGRNAISYSGNTISWYNTNEQYGSRYQYNLGTTYYAVAIG